MTKILILALSVSEETLVSHFEDSFREYVEGFSSDQVDLKSVVYLQGFSRESPCKQLFYVRDDSFYNKGFSISEIRDYFTSRAIREYCPDYILSCDDDFKFRSSFIQSLLRDLKFFIDSPSAGLSCMHYHKYCPEEEDLYEFNPSRVATRSGLFFRVSAYPEEGWGGQDKVRYFEECYLAAMIYKKGYQIYHSSSDTIHKTKPTGLGLSQEKKYGKNNIPFSGRKILCDKGYYVPSQGKLPDGSTYLRYDVPLKVSKILQKFHEEGLICLTKTV